MTEARRSYPHERTVHAKPGQRLRVTYNATHSHLSEAARRRKIEATIAAGDFFRSHFAAIEATLGADSMDMDSLQMDAGEELRGLATRVLDAGVDVGDLVRLTQGELLERTGGERASHYSAVARAFGGLIQGEIDLLLSERAR